MIGCQIIRCEAAAGSPSIQYIGGFAALLGPPFSLQRSRQRPSRWKSANRKTCCQAVLRMRYGIARVFIWARRPEKGGCSTAREIAFVVGSRTGIPPGGTEN
jgi:hypothetical protein